MWSYETGGPVDSSPAVLDDTLYVTSKDGNLYAFYEQIDDVAVTITSYPSKVTQNLTATISVNVENQGSFNESDIAVTAQYNTTLFNTTLINLTRGADMSLQIPWNATGVGIGNWTIYVNVTLALPFVDNDTSDNTKSVIIAVELGVHDIRITNVTRGMPGFINGTTIYEDNVGQNYTMTIYVTVRNEGNFTENNIIVKVYWSNDTHVDQLIGNATIAELNTTTTDPCVGIAWDTTGIDKGNYTISAEVEAVPGETNMSGNTLVDGIVQIGVPCDITVPTEGVPDGTCNMRDIGYMCEHFGARPGLNWDPNCDVTGPVYGVPDGVVNMRDIGEACSKFGERDP